MNTAESSLAFMAGIEQRVAEAEALTVEVVDDEILLTASALLAEHSRLLADVEWKLRSDDQSEYLKLGRDAKKRWVDEVSRAL